ncbi:hypothetical protein [Okeania sp. SIO1F9]|uniref:hypothetical protein n=1 Tax=Okeania sp. SIO1F9 TaxID=2607813 RepID=UPI00257A0379|nr:hypothetical protein [Okeania sp. SIO1F9]
MLSAPPCGGVGKPAPPYQPPYGCKDCVYDWKVRVTSPQDKGNNSPACPFNYFYWDFLARHRDKLKSQGRMNFVLANLDKIDSEELENIHLKAEKWHSQKTSCRSQGIGNRQ